MGIGEMGEGEHVKIVKLLVSNIGRRGSSE